SIHDKRDVIEYSISDYLDISGCAITKSLPLFPKSNPAFLDWIRPPFSFSHYFTFPELLQQMLENNFYPKATIYHYLHM
ncbi:DNA polymerase beta superfamily protein, partial [Bacillus thuringiensis]|uniref:DNA polymerase beta superfamily protein n=1 Tax=Bacillus thuringiensis TaxID=1428 RepID=UPI00284638B8